MLILGFPVELASFLFLPIFKLFPIFDHNRIELEAGSQLNRLNRSVWSPF